ncbi:polysaccharide biosynthesis protein, partial [Proteus mirabilis]
IGAAYSVLIIEFLSLTLMNYFFKNKIIWKLHIATLKMNFK